MEQMLTDIQAAIFDLDGTLVDSMWVWNAVDEEYFARHGMPVPEGLQEKIAGMSFSETAVYIRETYAIPDTLEEMKRAWTEMAEEKYANEVPLKPGAYEFLRLLRARGIKTGLATSNSRHLAEVSLEARGIRSSLDSVHTSCEVERGKPAPDIYLLVAQDLQVEPRHCLVFEDILEGIEAGKRAGMHTCAVADRATEGIWTQKQQAAEYAIRDYTELCGRTHRMARLADRSASAAEDGTCGKEQTWKKEHGDTWIRFGRRGADMR